MQWSILLTVNFLKKGFFFSFTHVTVCLTRKRRGKYWWRSKIWLVKKRKRKIYDTDHICYPISRERKKKREKYKYYKIYYVIKKHQIYITWPIYNKLSNNNIMLWDTVLMLTFFMNLRSDYFVIKSRVIYDLSITFIFCKKRTITFISFFIFQI